MIRAARKTTLFLPKYLRSKQRFIASNLAHRVGFCCSLIVCLCGFSSAARSATLLIDAGQSTQVPPYFFQSKQGDFTGFAYELMQLLSEGIDSNLYIRKVSDKKDFEDATQITIELRASSPETDEQASIILSRQPVYLVTLNDTKDKGPQWLNNRTLAVFHAIPQLVQQTHSAIDWVKFDRPRTALLALTAGQVDGVAMSRATFDFMMQLDLYTDCCRLNDSVLWQEELVASFPESKDALRNSMKEYQPTLLQMKVYEETWSRWFSSETQASQWQVKQVFIVMMLILLFLLLTLFMLRRWEINRLRSVFDKQLEAVTSRLNESNAYLTDLTITDTLTGISNRRAFESSLSTLIKRANRYQEPFAMLLLDIDDFKQLNDHFGHDVGDSVLRELSSRINQITRDADVLSRWGGEEFTLLMPLSGRTGALKMAERCRRVVADEAFEKAGRVTISLGGTCFQSGDSTRSLFKRADDALYRAKFQRKNCVVWLGDQCIAEHSGSIQV